MKVAAAGALVPLFVAVASANWNDTSTGIDLTRLPAFPLTKVRSGTLKAGVQVTFDGMVAKMVGPPGAPAVDKTVLQGRGKSGKPWSVHFAWIAFDQVYRGDLDGNGVPDYVVIGGSPYWNGRLAPPGRITVLLMDTQGLPVPFEAPLYDDLGPRHVVDVLHDGRARLALGSYDENEWDDRNSVFCSGHWVTDLYETNTLNWQPFQGTAAGVAFPLVHRWTYWPKCNDAPPAAWKEMVYTGQYSTASPDVRTRLEKSGAGWATVAPTADCGNIGTGTIVYDRRSRRDIALASGSGYQGGLQERILADGASVTLRGVYRQADGRNCSANLLWAAK